MTASILPQCTEICAEKNTEAALADLTLKCPAYKRGVEEHFLGHTLLRHRGAFTAVSCDPDSANSCVIAYDQQSRAKFVKDTDNIVRIDPFV